MSITDARPLSVMVMELELLPVSNSLQYRPCCRQVLILLHNLLHILYIRLFVAMDLELKHQLLHLDHIQNFYTIFLLRYIGKVQR